jgi:hypothetical protein
MEDEVQRIHPSFSLVSLDQLLPTLEQINLTRR